MGISGNKFILQTKVCFGDTNWAGMIAKIYVIFLLNLQCVQKCIWGIMGRYIKLYMVINRGFPFGYK